MGMKRVNEIIDLVGLEEKKKVICCNLSGGQRQKLALGIALIKHTCNFASRMNQLQGSIQTPGVRFGKY